MKGRVISRISEFQKINFENRRTRLRAKLSLSLSLSPRLADYPPDGQPAVDDDEHRSRQPALQADSAQKQASHGTTCWSQCITGRSPGRAAASRSRTPR